MDISGLSPTPTGTIRTYLRRRARWFLWTALGGVVLVSSTALFGVDKDQQAVVTIGLLVAIASMGAMRWIKCPRCQAAVGNQIARPLALPELFGQRPNFCLYCGVKLDDPMP